MNHTQIMIDEVTKDRERLDWHNINTFKKLKGKKLLDGILNVLTSYSEHFAMNDGQLSLFDTKRGELPKIGSKDYIAMKQDLAIEAKKIREA